MKSKENYILDYDIQTMDFSVYKKRRKYTQQFSWVALTVNNIEIIANEVRDEAIELMSGACCLPHALTKVGAHTSANIDSNFDSPYDCDMNQKYQNQLKDKKVLIDSDPLDVDLTEYRTIILSWVSYGSTIGTEILKKWITQAVQGDRLLVIGEGMGGCTADDTFFESILDLIDADVVKTHQKRLDNWFGIHDHLTVIEKI